MRACELSNKWLQRAHVWDSVDWIDVEKFDLQETAKESMKSSKEF